MKHLCHAIGCKVSVPPKMLMCLKHWKLVPREAQNDIWKTYVPGQEIRKDPTTEYLKAQQRAMAFVLKAEKPELSLEEICKIVLTGWSL